MEQNIYSEMATRIITEQEKIIGPVAYLQADTIPGLIVNRKSRTVTVPGNGAATIDSLVQSYKEFFGNAAVEVSKKAVGNLRFNLQPGQLPQSLR
ncbi:MAG TPA: hypothetical protein VGG13_01815 [Candidatus Saccharimonadales bacterium]|jgi:hypothetical protein